MFSGQGFVIRVEEHWACARTGIDDGRLSAAVRAVLEGEGLANAEVSVAVVDAPTMHALNRKHLEHDYPTDVLSFLLDLSEDSLEGEIIVSADEAAINAPKFGWSPADELTLYAVHGALHLCGYDDLEELAARVMRERERHWLSRLGIDLSPSQRAISVAAECQP